MRRFGKWSIGLSLLAFTAMPLLASGCAQKDESAAPANDAASSDSGAMDELPADDLGEPEAGSQL